MKIALFGGTFNPPHNEHILMGKQLLSFGYDQVIFAPNGIPPHKDCEMSFDSRLDMVRLAIKEEKNMQVCDLERNFQGNNYSYLMIPQYQQLFGQFDFVIGGDSLIDLHLWKNPDKVIQLVSLVVFNRGNRQVEFAKARQYWEERGARIQVIDYLPADISSTQIRFESRLGLIRNVPKLVQEYIEQNSLYCDQSLLQGAQLTSQIADKLMTYIKGHRYLHTLSTTYYALYLNKVCNLGLDTHKILLAGMLHDCAKGASIEHPSIPTDSIGTPVWHQFAGCVRAEQEFGITDEEILDAIRYHTTAKPNMSKLSKLICMADMIEETRDYPQVETLRNIAESNFEQGFVSCIQYQYEYLKNKNIPIYPLTRLAVDYYTKRS